MENDLKILKEIEMISEMLQKQTRILEAFERRLANLEQNRKEPVPEEAMKTAPSQALSHLSSLGISW
jgi:hypothetical protein